MPRLLRGCTIAGLGVALLFSLPAPASATTISGFGYIATDEVAFPFVDISGTGTLVIGNGDDASALANIGFNFNFYGNVYNSVNVSTNGLLSFLAGNTQFINVDLNTAAPAGDNPTIAPLWDDWLFFTAADGVYTQTVGAVGSRQFITQWHMPEPFGPFEPGNTVTFQAVLFEGSNYILFRYLDVLTGVGANTNGASATVGIRDTNGQVNGERLQWSFNSGVIQNGQSILFTPVPEPATLLLVGLGGLGLARQFRKRKSQN